MTDAAEPNPPRTLAIVIPVYNEARYIEAIFAQVEAVALNGLERQIIIVDDHSTDGTVEILQRLQRERPDLTIVFHARNAGKGAALRTGFAQVSSEIVLVQDADLEYDPQEYPLLLRPILQGKADVVYGSRFIGGTHRVLYYWHAIGNRVITTFCNMATNLNLTDIECCYKVFRREILERITLQENRFGFEPEVTAKVAKLRDVRIYEVPVSYAGRTYAEGKKINWKDGVSALRCIAKYGLFGAGTMDDGAKRGSPQHASNAS